MLESWQGDGMGNATQSHTYGCLRMCAHRPRQRRTQTHAQLIPASGQSEAIPNVLSEK